MKLVAATLSSPFAAVPATTFTVLVIPSSEFGYTESPTVTQYFLQSLGLSLFTVPISLLVFVVIGLPFFSMLRRTRLSLFPWFVLMAAGVASGIAWWLTGSFVPLWQLLAISCAASVTLFFLYLTDNLQ